MRIAQIAPLYEAVPQAVLEWTQLAGQKAERAKGRSPRT
jgi:hypothetical protein